MEPRLPSADGGGSAPQHSVRPLRLLDTGYKRGAPRPGSRQRPLSAPHHGHTAGSRRGQGTASPLHTDVRRWGRSRCQAASWKGRASPGGDGTRWASPGGDRTHRWGRASRGGDSQKPLEDKTPGRKSRRWRQARGLITCHTTKNHEALERRGRRQHWGGGWRGLGRGSGRDRRL